MTQSKQNQNKTAKAKRPTQAEIELLDGVLSVLAEKVHGKNGASPELSRNLRMKLDYLANKYSHIVTRGGKDA